MSQYTFASLYDDVLFELYSVRTAAATSDQKTIAKAVVNRGYRELVTKADWTCLHPPATLSITTGSTGDFDLPAGFAYMESGPIFHAADSGLLSVKQSTPGEILAKRAQGTSGSYPLLWAIRAKTFTNTTGQRWQLMTWPTPGVAVTVTYQFKSDPADMSNDAEYPVGGLAFNLAVRAFALKHAEFDKSQADGPRARQAQEALLSALLEDERQAAHGAVKITDGSRRVSLPAKYNTQSGITIT